MTEIFDTIDENLSQKVHLISENDRVILGERVENSITKLTSIVSQLNETKLNESDAKKLHEAMVKEASKLERLMIIEAVSNKSFFEVQKHFRSMLRAAGVIAKWFPKTNVSFQIEKLSKEGVELLSGLYDQIKALENGIDSDKSGVKVEKHREWQRDRFMKVFADFAVLFRGFMAVADLFSEDPAHVGGYNEIQDIVKSLETDERLEGEPLKNALKMYDAQIGHANSKKPGFFGRLMGEKQKGLTAKFVNAISHAIQSRSPGFAKLMPIGDVVSALMSKSVQQLFAYMGRFNDYVAADVDVDYLLSVSKNPRSIVSLFKGVLDAASSGHMKSMST